MTAAFRSDHLERAPAFLGLTESLHDVIERVRAAWVGEIAPGLRPGSVTIVVAHGNSLRALCAVVDHLSDAEIEDLNLPTGQPLLYEFADGGSPLKRGGAYLDPDTALPAARRIAEQGGT
jgi:2,3-bisphosphoglycerate-dependent phosphoglycerate mutase